jgi:hypothetical protein
MSNRDESLSDLDQARLLSRGLAGEEMDEETMVVEEQRFIKFSAASMRGRLTPPPPPRELELETAIMTPDLIHFDSWEGLLDWCLQVFSAEAAFVVGHEGFVIANRGSWSFAQLEGIGPQLQTLTERAVEIEEAGTVRFVTFQFESFWLAGICAHHEGMGEFILAFVCTQPMSSAARSVIQVQMEHNLHHL